jgi:PIN domain nuclease of toxin-antitoxin system
VGGRALILLDTQALLWLSLSPERLGPSADRLARAAWLVGDLHVSAISFWEVAVLIRKKKLVLRRPVADWRAGLLGAEINEVPVDGEMGCLAESLQGVNKDPADRLILATALLKEAALLTSDSDLLAWPNPLLRIDARR